MIEAALTDIRSDLKQKWEREGVEGHGRYIWLDPFQNRFSVKVGDRARLEFCKGTGGAVGGHWALWKVIEII